MTSAPRRSPSAWKFRECPRAESMLVPSACRIANISLRDTRDDDSRERYEVVERRTLHQLLESGALPFGGAQRRIHDVEQDRQAYDLPDGHVVQDRREKVHLGQHGGHRLSEELVRRAQNSNG